MDLTLRLVYRPTGTGPGDGQAVYFFFGFKAASATDRQIRTRLVEHIGDDIAALRAAGYRVIVEHFGALVTLEPALLGRHADAHGTRIAAIVWNGHGHDDGSIEAFDGRERIVPESLPGGAASAGVRLLVLGSCFAGGAADRWRAALGGAHVHGWGREVQMAEQVDFLTPDAARAGELDDLLREHLAAESLELTDPCPEVLDLLAVEREHAIHFEEAQGIPPAIARRRWRVGDRVRAQWAPNGLFYTGAIEASDGLRYRVRWDDGSTPRWVLGSQVRPDVVWEAGSQVLAEWDNGQYYAGLVTEHADGYCNVTWRDGSPPSWVSLGRIRCAAP